MFKRFGMFAVTGVLALTVLAACGSEDDEAEPTVTRVPATNAPQVTATAAKEEEEAAASAAVGSPAASPGASESASPVANVTTDVTVTVAAVSPIASSPISATEATVAQSFEVDMVDIAFNPKEITIPANTDVVIQLPNNGMAAHNFNIDALGVNSGDVAPGQSATVTINAEPGTYEYYCSIPGHKEAGMVGKLIVQ